MRLGATKKRYNTAWYAGCLQVIAPSSIAQNILTPSPVNDFVDVKVLGEAATVVAGNFQDISRQICKKLPRIPLEQQQTLQKSVFKYQSTHMFHILRDGSIVYLCMTPQPIGETQQTLPFQLLNDVRGHVVRKYRDSIQNIYPDEMQVQNKSANFGTVC